MWGGSFFLKKTKFHLVLPYLYNLFKKFLYLCYLYNINKQTNTRTL